MSVNLVGKSAAASTKRGMGPRLAAEPHPNSPEPPSSDSPPLPPDGVKFPDGSKKTVYCSLQAVRTADRDQRFSGSWLKSEHGVGQEKQGMRLLRWAALIDDHASLRSDVLDNRGSLSLFAQLLRERFHRGLEKAGIPADLCKKLGSKEYEWSQLRDDLQSAAPISSLTSNVRNNVIGSLKALDEVLRHVAEDGWLENKARSPKSSPAQDAGATDPTTQDDGKPYTFPVITPEQDLTASVKFLGHVRDRSSALKKLAELLVQMAGK